MYYDIRFRVGSSILVGGPSKSGKTVLSLNLIRFESILFEQKHDRIIWISGTERPKELPSQVIFSSDLHENILPNDLVFYDDQMINSRSSKYVTKLFTEICHHLPATIVFIVQNIFEKSSESRSRSLNTSYMFLTRSVRDSSQIEYLGREIFPRNKNYLRDAYDDATRKPYSYLLIDLHQETPDEIRLRTNVFPNESGPVLVYSKVKQ